MTSKQPPQLIDPTGRTHELTGDQITIGRAVENEIVITSKRISREHARISREGWRVMLEDLGSTNGTYLNNERISHPMQLRDGDQINVGDVSFTFRDPDVTFQDTPLPELDIDVPGGVVRVNRQLVTLAPKEFMLLTYLFENEREVCSKDEIGRAVWPEYQDGVYDYQIENLVRRLRAKLEPDSANPQLLLTVRGRGYKLLPR
jgi:pSer/pThr/pTyr-binding forkhead associated (FHA) protein